MGALTSKEASSLKNTAIFQKELSTLQNIVNSILDKKDMFQNKKFNFLTENVCNQYYVLMNHELEKHLKVELKSLGTSLYLIPKSEEQKINDINLTKAEICQMIANHYTKILYILCLIKYVFDLENHGDRSIAGIVFKNIRFVDDIMQINYCKVPHKDPRAPSHMNQQIDLNNLEGVWFFTQYFLTFDEAKTFISLMRTLLARKPIGYLNNQLDVFSKTNNITLREKTEYDHIFNMKGGEENKHPNRKLNTHVFIEKNNPIFSTSMCFAQGSPVIIKTSTKEGKKTLEMFNIMKNNYKTNIHEIEKIMNKIVKKEGDSYTLCDITKKDLDIIIEDLKIRAKVFYFQSLYDFQRLLGLAMKSKERLGIYKLAE